MGKAGRITDYGSRITHHPSPLPHLTSRMTHHASPITHHSSLPFDVIVIGGGIIGTGIARDAALRGLRVALVEREDFGAGTTSRSTRLIHGGLRYLEQGDFGLVRQDLRERELLLRNARHLVRALPFLVPFYRRGTFDRLKLRAGLAVYD